MKTMTEGRDYRVDNIRCLLMFLTVFGHLLEGVGGGAAAGIYRVIYTFHMPAFIFVTGYFASFRPKRILTGFACPYFIFQVLYITFNRLVLNNPLPFQFATPNWILWYLMSMTYYFCLIPLLRTDRVWRRALTLALTAAISVGAGYFDRIGYEYSLSRTLVFLPFFAAGYYAGHPSKGRGWTIWRVSALRCAAIAGAGAMGMYFFHEPVDYFALYRVGSYALGGSGPALRTALMLTAAMWLVLLFSAAPSRRLPVLSSLGANTMPVYLLHGFAVLYIRSKGIFKFGQPVNIVLAAALAVLMLLLFGNPYMGRAFRFILNAEWLKRKKDAGEHIGK